MPSLKGGLFSLSAIGTLNKELVYFWRDGKQISRQYVIPEQPNTDDQIRCQLYLRIAHLAWKALSQENINLWNLYRHQNHIPGRYGYHWFISRYLDFLAFTGGVCPVAPFLPQSAHPESPNVICGGYISGSIPYLEPYHARVVIVTAGTDIVKSVTQLENNQEFWQSVSLPAGVYNIFFESDNFSSFNPPSFLSIIKTTSGVYSEFSTSFAVNATTVHIGGGIFGDLNYLGTMGATIHIWDSEQNQEYEVIQLQDNQQGWYSNLPYSAGEYLIIADPGSMNAVDPISYPITVTPPSDSLGVDFTFSI